jgi:hypothetical protein
MLYSMARRYDDIPGTKADTGSTLRAALKGWHRHGVCRGTLWKGYDMPKVTTRGDWWQDAARRPLGAYYRIDTRSVTDMHVALNEVGVIYASAVCHSGWDEGVDLSAKARRGWTIPAKKVRDEDVGHAFAIVGYDAEGFLVLNSWGKSWGDGGIGRLRYDDWLDNAMDAWVVQLGVVTEQHRAVARSETLRLTKEGNVSLAQNEMLKNHEIAPFVVNVANDGKLSSTGRFRTTEKDLDALFDVSFPAFREAKKLGHRPADIVLYAHGGLVSEDDAAETAARVVPRFYDAGVFPIFFMWETDLLSTLRNIVDDAVEEARHDSRPTAGLRDQLKRFWNSRVERLLSAPGSAIWGEMKENAERISSRPDAGGPLLFAAAMKHVDPKKVRIHLVGHSAGSIVLSHLASALVKQKVPIASMTFMAPAVRVDVFREHVLQHLGSGIGRYAQLHLTEDAEQRDSTCRPILGYGRSLLYLVSRSFEGSRDTPILGLEEDFATLPKKTRDGITVLTAPKDLPAVTTHGGFDDGEAALSAVVRLVRGA